MFTFQQDTLRSVGHEGPNEPETPIRAFQQGALLFLADLGERPDMFPGLCVVEQGRVVFVMDALGAVGCVRARILEGSGWPMLGGTPRGASGRRHGPRVLFAEANIWGVGSERFERAGRPVLWGSPAGSCHRCFGATEDHARGEVR